MLASDEMFLLGAGRAKLELRFSQQCCQCRLTQFGQSGA